MFPDDTVTEGWDVAPAGWYPDPDMVDTLRYWNGDDWSDRVAPMHPRHVEERSRELAAQPIATGNRPVHSDKGRGESNHDDNSTVITFGVITAFLFPILGLAIGLTQINRKGGLGVIALSIVGFLIWFGILSGRETL